MEIHYHRIVAVDDLRTDKKKTKFRFKKKRRKEQQKQTFHILCIYVFWLVNSSGSTLFAYTRIRISQANAVRESTSKCPVWHDYT